MSEEPNVWEIRLGLYATQEQAEQVKEQIQRLLCPDPGHEPPCPIPWSTLLLHQSDLEDEDSYSELVEQARIEQPHRQPRHGEAPH